MKQDEIVLEGNILDVAKAYSLAESYDLYVGAIDNGSQYRAQKNKNEDILEEIKDMGVTKISWLNHSDMMSTRVYTKSFEL